MFNREAFWLPENLDFSQALPNDISGLSCDCPPPGFTDMSLAKGGGLSGTCCGSSREKGSCAVLVLQPPKSTHPSQAWTTYHATRKVFAK
jgi:hypothetical protein